MAKCKRKSCTHNNGGRCELYLRDRNGLERACPDYGFDMFAVLVNKPIWRLIILVAIIAVFAMIAWAKA